MVQRGLRRKGETLGKATTALLLPLLLFFFPHTLLISCSLAQGAARIALGVVGLLFVGCLPGRLPPSPHQLSSLTPNVLLLRSWLRCERERWASHFSAQGRRIFVSGTFWAPRGFRGDSQRSSRDRKLTFAAPKYVFWALLGFSKDT